MIRRFRFTLIFGAIGILGGIIYSELIGCETGCTLKSSPFIMALYGALMGGILGSFIDDYRKRKSQKQ